MAAKALLTVVGLAGVGLFLASRKSSAAAPEPQIEEPESSTGEPPIPGVPPSGSGEPEVPPEVVIDTWVNDPWIKEKMDWLPTNLQNINLSGNEQYHYIGEETITDKHCVPECQNKIFNTWLITDSLNGMSIKAWVYAQTNWIAVFLQPDGHRILYKMQGNTQNDRDWFTVNILGRPAGTYQESVLAGTSTLVDLFRFP